MFTFVHIYGQGGLEADAFEKKKFRSSVGQ